MAKGFNNSSNYEEKTPIWYAQLPVIRPNDYAGKALRVRFVGDPFCVNIHSVFTNLEHAKLHSNYALLNMIEGRRKKKPDLTLEDIASYNNIPLVRLQEAVAANVTKFNSMDPAYKSFPVYCPAFDSDTETIKGDSCEIDNHYTNLRYIRSNKEYWCWAFVQLPDTEYYMPNLKLVRFTSGIYWRLGEIATERKSQPTDNEAGYSLTLKYQKNSDPKKMWSIDFWANEPLSPQQLAVCQAEYKPIETLFIPTSPEKIARDLERLRYPSLIGRGPAPAPRAAAPGFDPNGYDNDAPSFSPPPAGMAMPDFGATGFQTPAPAFVPPAAAPAFVPPSAGAFGTPEAAPAPAFPSQAPAAPQASAFGGFQEAPEFDGPIPPPPSFGSANAFGAAPAAPASAFGNTGFAPPPPARSGGYVPSFLQDNNDPIVPPGVN